MTCFEFEQSLQEQLDRRCREWPSELHAHAKDCADCQKLAGSFRAVEGSVVAWRMLGPDVDLAEQILHRLAADDGRQVDRSTSEFDAHSTLICEPVRRVSFTSIVALSVAALAVVIFTSVAWRSSEQIRMAKSPSNAKPTAIVPWDSGPQFQSAAAGDQKLDLLIHDAREAYAMLASQAWQHVSTVETLLPSKEAAIPFPNEEFLHDMPNSLAPPLKPWGSELRNAVESWIDQVLTSQESST